MFQVMVRARPRAPAIRDARCGGDLRRRGPQSSYLREWLPWVDRTNSAAEIRDFIAARLEQLEGGQGPNAAIWLDGQIVGAVGCHPIEWSNRNCSIGYWIDAGCQGKGIMTRCCAALMDCLFDDMDCIASRSIAARAIAKAAPSRSVSVSPARA